MFKKLNEIENKKEILEYTDEILNKFIHLNNTDAYASLKYHNFLLSDEILSDENDSKLINFFKNQMIQDLILLNTEIEFNQGV